MDYHVILIESGRPTHHWFYHDATLAICQLERLMLAYEEVNEVSATIVKAGLPERDLTCTELLQGQIVRPDFDLD